MDKGSCKWNYWRVAYVHTVRAETVNLWTYGQPGTPRLGASSITGSVLFFSQLTWTSGARLARTIHPTERELAWMDQWCLGFLLYPKIFNSRAHEVVNCCSVAKSAQQVITQINLPVFLCMLLAFFRKWNIQQASLHTESAAATINTNSVQCTVKRSSLCNLGCVRCEAKVYWTWCRYIKALLLNVQCWCLRSHRISKNRPLKRWLKIWLQDKTNPHTCQKDPNRKFPDWARLHSHSGS